MIRAILIGVLSLACSSGTAQELYKKVTSVEGVTEYQFTNGARVLLFPDGSQPTITVNMTVLVGSRHEGYGEAGMAHLLEHMVFKGTPTFPDVPTALRDHGASFNGTTNRDRTNYFETLPATDENLEFAIHMESDRLINSYVKNEDLQSEFTVVRNEFERGENSPTRVLFQRVMAASYEWHNYGKTTIGNRTDIERVPIDNLKAFYKKYYQPDNVVMIVTGRFQEEKALKLLSKHLGSIPKPTRKLDATYTEEPAQDGERYVELRRVGNVGSIIAAYHIPAASHEDWAPLSILGSVLSEQKVGLLEKKLVETKIATSASGRSDSAHDPGLFTFSAQPNGENLEETKTALLALLDTLGKQEFSSEAVARAKKRSARGYERTLQSASSMSSALSSASSLGDWRLMFLQRDRLAKVTAKDVKRVAAKYFPAYNRTLGVFIPTETPRRMRVPQVVSIADVVKDYKGGEALASGEVFNPTPENLEKRVRNSMLGDINVGILEKKNRGETVNLSLTLRYGNAESLKDKTVASALLPTMLMAGTKTMDRQALRAKMTELGVRISSGGGRGRRGGGGSSPGQLSFSISAKKESLGAAIELLEQIMKEPAFPEDYFDQIKRRMVTGMKSSKTDPQSLASNMMSRALSDYPKDDIRYVPTIEESIERMEKVSLSDIKEIYETQISNAKGEVSVVGEFDSKDTTIRLAKLLEGWKSEVEYSPINRVASTSIKGSKKNINTPDKANAVFMIGYAFSLTRDEADSDALQLGNFILGGGTLSSRLGNRIRQKEGLSYGVSSSVSVPNEGTDARFSIRAITNPANIDAVEKAAFEELTKFMKDGPTEKELADAKVAWLERQKLSRSRDGSIAGQIKSNAYYGRDFKYIREKEEAIKALTREDIITAFNAHIDLEKLIVIRAGDFGSKEKE